MNAEPTKTDKKRISLDVNEKFHIELYKKTRDDRTTVSELIRQFLEQYMDGKFKVSK